MRTVKINLNAVVRAKITEEGIEMMRDYRRQWGYESEEPILEDGNIFRGQMHSLLAYFAGYDWNIGRIPPYIELEFIEQGSLVEISE